MHSITFNQSGSSVTISGTIVYPLNFSDKKKNQCVERNLSGSNIVYSTGNTICNGLLNVKNISYSDKELLKAWIRDTILFMKYTFTLSEASGLVNFGKGKGVSLTSVRFTKTDLKDIFTSEEPGVFTLKFPYRFIRT